MLIDIAVNITDKQFVKDYEEIILDCKRNKVLPIFVGTDYESSLESIKIAKQFNTLCYVGIHPTSKGNFNDLIPFFSEECVIAVGECGLDYDRLNFTSKEYQINNFKDHLDFNAGCYFFHCRNAYDDFIKMVHNKKGVVHSFTGTKEEAFSLIKKGLFIGINGCSLKTEEGINLVKELPLDKIILETDAPYCKIRKSSSAYQFISTDENEKKYLRRNVPVTVKQVAECISKIKNVSLEEVEIRILENTIQCFGEKIKNAIEKFFD